MSIALQYQNIGRRSRLTISALIRIRERTLSGGYRYSSMSLGEEFSYSSNYIRSIRRGERDPIPLEDQPERAEVPADYVPHNKVGKPRALSDTQVDEIQGAIAIDSRGYLGNRRALAFACKFGVHISTVYKARSGLGCYGEV